MRFILLLALSGFMVGCELPWQVEDEYELASVPDDYLVWFMEVSTCMGRPGQGTPARFSRIQWHAGTDILNPSEGRRAWGLWTEPHKITIREDKLLQEHVVKHEIVHDLLGRGSHDGPHFVDCAGI